MNYIVGIQASKECKPDGLKYHILDSSKIKCVKSYNRW